MRVFGFAGSFALAAGMPGCAPPSPAVTLPAIGPPATAAACPHVPAQPKAQSSLPPPPVSGFRQILQPGHWTWSGQDYAWSKPRWLTLLGRSKPLWQAEFWEPRGGGCVWQKAHFIFPRPRSASIISRGASPEYGEHF